MTSTDPRVFYACIEEHILILVVHVDDCVLTGSSKDLIATYKQKLNACYMLTDLGPLHWLLGIKVTCNHAAHTTSLSQTSYINCHCCDFRLEKLSQKYAGPKVVM